MVVCPHVSLVQSYPARQMARPIRGLVKLTVKNHSNFNPNVLTMADPEKPKPTELEIKEAIDEEIFDGFGIPEKCKHFNAHVEEDYWLDDGDKLDVFRNLEEKWGLERDSSPIGVVCTVEYLGEMYDYWICRMETGDDDGWSIPRQKSLVEKIKKDREEGHVPVKYDPNEPFEDVEPEKPPTPVPPPRTALLFSGQGVQYKGMCEMCGLTNYEARNYFCRADDILGYNLYELCRIDENNRLNQTEFSQIAIMVSSLAAVEELKLAEPELLEGVEACAGLSLGEYSALVYADAISFEDAVKVIKVRGQAMQRAAEKGADQGMTAVIAQKDIVDEMVDEINGSDDPVTLFVSNYLAPENQVIAGAVPSLQKFEELAKKKNILSTRIAVNGAFHTTYMQPASDELNKVLDNIEIKLPETIKVIDNVTGKPFKSADEIRDLLKEQITSPVRWMDSVNAMLDAKVERFVELGPGAEIKRKLPGKEEEEVVGRKTILTAKRIMGAILADRKEKGQEEDIDLCHWMV